MSDRPGDKPVPERPGTQGYRAGTEGYHAGEAGTEGYRAGTEGYHAHDGGTEGYPPGTSGYQGGEGPSAHAAGPDSAESSFDLDAYLDDLELPDPKREAIEAALDKYMKPVQELDDEIHGRRDAEGYDPPGGWMPGLDLAEDDGDLPGPPQPAYRQVNLKLSWDDYGELENAAELYGLRPTTLARALVRRGSRAILETFRREERLGMPPLKSSRRSGSGA